LAEVNGIVWIRLLYCYPEEITEELAELFSTEKKLLPYIDLPIQHASDEILRRMGRRTNRAELANKIRMLREKTPEICLRTTLITGFPGETEEDVNILADFIEEMRFDRLGVFAYSMEEGTPAAEFPDQIEEEEKENRRGYLMETQQEIAFEKAASMVGKELLVMIEGWLSDEGTYVGRSYMDAPGIDGLVFVKCENELMTGDFIKVAITGSYEYDLMGEPV
jgi:ribosomal protein S12 methylthiotransferase